MPGSNNTEEWAWGCGGWGKPRILRLRLAGEIQHLVRCSPPAGWTTWNPASHPAGLSSPCLAANVDASSPLYPSTPASTLFLSFPKQHCVLQTRVTERWGGGSLCKFKVRYDSFGYSSLYRVRSSGTPVCPDRGHLPPHSCPPGQIPQAFLSSSHEAHWHPFHLARIPMLECS